MVGTGVGEVVTGTDIPLTAAQIANMAAQNVLSARGQDITVRGQDLQAQASQRQFALDGQRAAAQYYIDVQRVGLDKARLNYEQRLGEAQQRLNESAQGFSQRQGAANTKLAALKMLADRSGPQDWVAYDYLKNRLGRPTGQNVDPTSFANDLVDPRFLPGGAGMGTTGINVPYEPTGGAPPAFTSFAGSGGGSAPAYVPPAIAPFGGAPAYTPPAYVPPSFRPVLQSPISNVSGSAAGTGPNDYLNFSGVRNEDVAGLTSGQRKFVTTGGRASSLASDYQGFRVFGGGGNELTGNQEIAGGTPIWLQKLSQGTKHGMIRDLLAIVGEGKGQKPGKTKAQRTLGNTGEVMVNPTGAPVGVMNNAQAKRMLSGARGALGRGALGRKPRRYAGGTGLPGEPDWGMPTTMNFKKYAPGVLANQPFYQKLIGNMPADEWTGFGAKLSNPALGIQDAPGAFSMQRYAAMDPGERDQLQSLYSQGLGVDFRDMLERARRSAPTGVTFGPTGYN